MFPVKIAEKKVWVGDIDIPLLSGEVHYWRLDPGSWRPVLQRAREMGLGVIATYVCWDFHEIEPGRYDFHGQTGPRRDLAGFLDLLTAEGFWIILRPGPYIYSEWRNNAVTLTFGQSIQKAVECNLLEEDEKPVSYQGNQLMFAIQPFEIKTFKVWF